ncbi:ABC transporter ATP-binding protein [Levyella massiliensis]|uniref:ABC transporter ATP-binding protein n=1 Tax=Levyella massiliensis TaxID=938289 RepID=UPI0023F2C10B|nr:ABC transporter ATP-binding protein [Levyella massiliensis]
MGHKDKHKKEHSGHKKRRQGEESMSEDKRVVPVSELLRGAEPDPVEEEPVAETVETPTSDWLSVPTEESAENTAENIAEDTAPLPVVDDEAIPEDGLPEGEGEPVVLISHLSKKIAGQTVLKDINLALLNGHVLGLLGPNGSGKTTLLRILAGLAHKSGGRVEIDGMEPGTETKALVSYLPDTLFLSDDMTVERARHYFETFFMDFDRERFDALAERLALPKHTKISKMSKGYRDRLAVSLAMSRRARLYLLDEPLGGVDPIVRDEVLDILIEALGDEATMLITTHQVRDLERIFDEVCFLKEGSIVRYGAAEAIRQEENADLDAVYRTIFG